MKHIALITPAISSLNIGDQIVLHYCRKALNGIFKDVFFVLLPAYNKFDERSKYILDKCDLAFFCGTAPLRNKLAEHWVFENGDYQNKVVLMGCGWNKYEEGDMNTKSTLKLLSALSSINIHSFRDRYSHKMFEKNYILDTIVTACPSMWEIDPNKIATKKSNGVVFTLNAARGDFVQDRKLCDLIKRNYNDIYFFAQSPYDYDYLKSMEIECQIIQSHFSSFDKFLCDKEVDYVGSRLHGGIHALNRSRRAFIISVDNRAESIAYDTNLPVFKRDGLEGLEEMINSDFLSDIVIPEDSINEWSNQFF